MIIKLTLHIDPSIIIIVSHGLTWIYCTNSNSNKWTEQVKNLKRQEAGGNTSWLHTSIAEELNQVLPGTNPASDRRRTWMPDHQISSPVPWPLSHAAPPRGSMAEWKYSIEMLQRNSGGTRLLWQWSLSISFYGLKLLQLCKTENCGKWSDMISVRQPHMYHELYPITEMYSNSKQNRKKRLLYESAFIEFDVSCNIIKLVLIKYTAHLG